MAFLGMFYYWVYHVGLWTHQNSAIIFTGIQYLYIYMFISSSISRDWIGVFLHGSNDSAFPKFISLVWQFPTTKWPVSGMKSCMKQCKTTAKSAAICLQRPRCMHCPVIEYPCRIQGYNPNECVSSKGLVKSAWRWDLCKKDALPIGSAYTRWKFWQVSVNGWEHSAATCRRSHMEKTWGNSRQS